MNTDGYLVIEIEYGYEDFLCEIEKRKPTKEFTAAVKHNGRVFVARAPGREQAIDALLLSLGLTRAAVVEMVDLEEEVAA